MTKPASHGARLQFLDITKGFLVALMVVYHSLNYTSEYQLGFRYFSFLPQSFILITGFLVSLVYYRRIEAREEGLTARMLVRGLRLLALFVALNVAAQYVRSPHYGQAMGVEAFFGNWWQVFVTGGARLGGVRLTVFDILLPIAYLLIIAPLLLHLARLHRLALAAFTSVLVIACYLLAEYDHGIDNLRLISVGIVGMLLGRLVTEPARIGALFWPATLAMAAFIAFSEGRGYLYSLQLGGAVIALLFFAGLSLHAEKLGFIAGILARIGQYSLIAYIVQIAALQVLSRFVGRPDPLSLPAAISFAGTSFVMMAAIEITRWLRSRWPLADRAYRLVFA